MVTVKYITLNKKRNIYYTILFFIGIVVTGFVFYFISKTIISFRIPFLISIITAFITSKLDKANYNNTYKFFSNWEPKLYSFFQNLFTWGAFVVFNFMLSNYYLPKGVYEEKEFKIIEMYKTHGGKGNRNREDCDIVIESNGNFGTVSFRDVNHNDIDKIKSVTINVKKGFWGYDVYNSKRLNWKE